MSLSNNDLENIYETLNTAGWDLLISEFQESLDSCNQIVGCESERDLFLRKGMITVYTRLLQLRDDIKEQMSPDADL